MGAVEGIVEPAEPVEWLVAGPVAAGLVERTALDLDRVRT
jgi:hypothetical protein